jgi:hypothetical protein
MCGSEVDSLLNTESVAMTISFCKAHKNVKVRCQKEIREVDKILIFTLEFYYTIICLNRLRKTMINFRIIYNLGEIQTGPSQIQVQSIQFLPVCSISHFNRVHFV